MGIEWARRNRTVQRTRVYSLLLQTGRLVRRQPLHAGGLCLSQEWHTMYIIIFLKMSGFASVSWNLMTSREFLLQTQLCLCSPCYHVHTFAGIGSLTHMAVIYRRSGVVLEGIAYKSLHTSKENHGVSPEPSLWWRQTEPSRRSPSPTDTWHVLLLIKCIFKYKLKEIVLYSLWLGDICCSIFEKGYF